ncbi:SPOR domain-containing protein [beta proteobacterium MWH-UniP1]
MPADSDSGSSQREHQRSDPMAEHKRRARWRLLGALIITGAVAAVAPIFLEDQARPLSQDLLIDIPSKNSAFNKIDSLKPAATEAPQAPAAATPATAPVAPAASAPKAEAKAEAKPEQKADTKSEAKTNGKSAVDTKATADAKATAKSATTAAAPATATDKKVAPAKGFLVQVGAYAKLESANAVKTKLAAGGHRVVMETIKAEDGADRYRVRIGPFETREQALSVRDRAKGQGYDAVVVNP